MKGAGLIVGSAIALAIVIYLIAFTDIHYIFFLFQNIR